MTFLPPSARMREIKAKAAFDRGTIAEEVVEVLEQPVVTLPLMISIEDAVAALNQKIELEDTPQIHLDEFEKGLGNEVVDDKASEDIFYQETPVQEIPLSDYSRNDLNSLASSLGIEKPEKFANKTVLIEAIQAAQATK